MIYKDELTKAMRYLGAQDNTVFLGQGVRYKGHAMFDTLVDVPMEKRIELPVMEDAQMGFSIGLSLQGFIPISIYPRMDFLLLAMNQLVNHLDKMREMSSIEWEPKVIIRTMIGSKLPLDGGIQHTGDYTEGLSKLLNNIDVVSLDKPESIAKAYKWAFKNDNSTILVEKGDEYNS